MTNRVNYLALAQGKKWAFMFTAAFCVCKGEARA